MTLARIICSENSGTDHGFLGALPRAATLVKTVVCPLFLDGTPGAALHPSRPSETDGDFSRLDDDRNATAAGETHHPVQFFRVTPDVDVVEGDFSTRVVLTGR